MTQYAERGSEKENKMEEEKRKSHSAHVTLFT